MTNKTNEVNYVGPFITMVFLFFIVGFLTVVFQQFQKPLETAFLASAGSIKNTLAVMVTFTWFLAYPIAGGWGSKWVDAHGSKTTLVRALLIMVVGLVASALSPIMYGSSPDLAIGGIPVAFFIFLVGSFITGCAATVLQVVINPYLAASKVKGTSDVQRITIGGSSNSIGTTFAPYFVSTIVFGGAAVADIQIDQVIAPFFILAATIAVVAFIVSKLTLPNIQGTTNEEGGDLPLSIWSFSHLKLGVIAIFAYVGVEVAIGANINMYATWLGGSYAESAATMTSMYWAGLLVGRLCASFLSQVSAKTQLVVTSVIATVLVGASIATGNPWLLVGAGLMHSIMWSAIFSLAIKDLGKYTSKGSGALMIGVVGGAILPLVQSMIADALGGDWSMTWIIVVIGELYLLYYALIGSKVKQQG